MSALIPLLNELLPMIMPAEVHITPASEIEEAIEVKEEAVSEEGTARIVRQGALVNCGSMCASDTILMAISGTGVLLTLPDIEANEPTRNALAAGSFAFVPAWTEHQIINETDRDVRWTIVQSGPKPVVVDLDGWAGDEIKKPKNRAKAKKQKEGWVVVKP
ncbi:hypothetical protein MKZ38_003896 [Zalerion maritima]|uniref:Uncharacterized protein n=1 Tax=Zalerion maritima TaxID=339359 RepID=A0AAD5RWL7_9PEZI|nr:hypothetical protein MKZ38_003896 [Zalerion maritima]